jgi:alkylhydroperoxidase family enzyme
VGGKHSQAEIRVEAVADGGEAGDIPHAHALIAFVDACFAHDVEKLRAARETLIGEMSPQACVDAAAVIGCFEAFNRIADATGIPLDENTEKYSGNLRQKLNLNVFDQRNREM